MWFLKAMKVTLYPSCRNKQIRCSIKTCCHRADRCSGREIQPGSQTGAETKISRYTYLENKYGPSLAAVVSGKIWKGMNAQMVKDSWAHQRKSTGNKWKYD